MTDKASAIVVPESKFSFVSSARSQSTTIEQTRAVAEVHGAIMVAKRSPRDKAKAISEMEDSCRIPALAKRAFFRFPRGGQTISGPSVHLARELARCWGNLDYGVKELDRDDAGGQSEMLAFAWDLETNTRSETTFIVPHKRDKKGGAEVLTDLRDIYENNANNGARRLRECIFAVLPPWFTEQAKELCAETLRHGGGKPRDIRCSDAIKAYNGIGVSRDRLERKMGAPASEWTDVDLANLEVIFASIRRGEVNKEDEFPLADVDPTAGKTASRLDALEETITGEDGPPARTPAVDPGPADGNSTKGSDPSAPETNGSGGGAPSAWDRNTDTGDYQVGNPFSREVRRFETVHAWCDAVCALAHQKTAAERERLWKANAKAADFISDKFGDGRESAMVSAAHTFVTAPDPIMGSAG